MKCPNCKEDLVLPGKCYRNLETYNPGGVCLVSSECCNTGFVVQMYISYKTTTYIGDKDTDDWGTKINKYEYSKKSSGRTKKSKTKKVRRKV